MIHPESDVLSENIGEDTLIWQYCVVLPGAMIGRNCNLCAHVFVENNVVIGNNVTIKNGVQLWDGITIEDDVFIGPNATFTNELVPRSKNHKLENIKTTVIKKGATIGANATILPEITIGEYAFIGAGSVVTSDVPSNALFYGNPAKQKGYITNEGVVLDMTMRDKFGVFHDLNHDKHND